eukprot:1136175-Lingulodinium_polyedra.AAC.1
MVQLTRTTEVAASREDEVREPRTQFHAIQDHSECIEARARLVYLRLQNVGSVVEYQALEGVSGAVPLRPGRASRFPRAPALNAGVS